MEEEQIGEMVATVDREDLSNIEWWEAAWSSVEPFTEEMDREDKSIFGWAEATALARDIVELGDPNPDRAKFMAAMFSIEARNYIPTAKQITVGEFLRGMYLHMRAYGIDQWAEIVSDPERFGRGHPLWRRFYRESKYFLSITPQSLFMLMEDATTLGYIRQSTLDHIARTENRSYRSIAINLRYIYKYVDDPAFLEAARLAERLHKRHI